MEFSRFPAAQITPHPRRLNGAIRLLLLARRALAHAHLSQAVHRGHDHRALAARASRAAPAALVQVVLHPGRQGFYCRPLHLRPMEEGPLQLRNREVHTAQNRILQIKDVVALQPLKVSRFPAAQIESLHQRAADE
eukprot:scaffold68507_cov63-Phaeocystis_antarctica.AAC.2